MHRAATNCAACIVHRVSRAPRAAQPATYATPHATWTALQYIGELCRYLLAVEPSPAEKKHKIRIAIGNGLRPEIWDTFQKRSAPSRTDHSSAHTARPSRFQQFSKRGRVLTGGRGGFPLSEFAAWPPCSFGIPEIGEFYGATEANIALFNWSRGYQGQVGSGRPRVSRVGALGCNRACAGSAATRTTHPSVSCRQTGGRSALQRSADRAGAAPPCARAV
jgi:hypothetical protein